MPGATRETMRETTRENGAGESDIAASMETQFSGAAGRPGEQRPAMARIRLRGWFAIRLESIVTVTGNRPVPRSMGFPGRKSHPDRRLLHTPYSENASGGS